MRFRIAAVIALAISAIAGEARAAPCAGFVDVDDAIPSTSAFCQDVVWIRNRGVTLGCTPTQYCPFEFVSRLQMAAFMRRLGEALFPSTCAAGQLLKWDGAAWRCANDDASIGNGTVISIASGTGLAGAPNPLTAAGSIGISPSYRLPQPCTSGQVPKSNGSGGWACAADASSGGTVTNVATGTGLTGGPITTNGTVAINTATIQARVTGSCSAGSSIRAINGDGSVTCETDDDAGTTAFVQGGNAFGTTAVVGTTDFQALDIRASGRAMRYEPNTISPNVVGGSRFNAIGTGVRGATVAGGGTNGAFFDPDPDFTDEDPNRVIDAYSTIRGGLANVAGFGTGSTVDDAFGTVAGGRSNRAESYSTVAGGWNNGAGWRASMVSGGEGNNSSESEGYFNAIGGGRNNTMESVQFSAILGGINNRAQHFSAALPPVLIAGGLANFANDYGNSVLGGSHNRAGGDNLEAQDSIAAGTWANANLSGCVVFSLWGGSSPGQSCAIPPGDPAVFAGHHRFRIGAVNGFSVDYAVRRSDGGGERWVYIGGLIAGNTITAWNGARLSDGGAWLIGSDRAGKENFEPIDEGRMLEAVARLPIERWFYRAEGPKVQRIGPTSQDFRAAFALGADDRTIATVDSASVALVAIKGLHRSMRSREAELARLHLTADVLLGRLRSADDSTNAIPHHVRRKAE